MKEKISILIPAYNEGESIKGVVEEIKKVIGKQDLPYEIVVINDGSKDQTKEIIEKIEDIRIINNPYNLGYGMSLKKGLKIAEGKYVLITDADGTYPIARIPDLLKYIDSYDMIIGARTGKNVSIPLIRRPAKWIIGKFANFLSGKKIPDINSGLRVFNKEKALEFYNLYPSGFSFTTTITLAFLTNDYTIKYISINYNKREGSSSIRPVDFLGFIALIGRIMIYFKPLKFFFLPGLFISLIGFIYGIYQVMIAPTKGLGQLPILLIILGIQIVLLGIIADLIAKSRK